LSQSYVGVTQTNSDASAGFLNLTIAELLKRQPRIRAADNGSPGGYCSLRSLLTMSAQVDDRERQHDAKDASTNSFHAQRFFGRFHACSNPEFV
jgi:hypothetical protein